MVEMVLVLAGAILCDNGRAGRVGSTGGSSASGLLASCGGLLKGDRSAAIEGAWLRLGAFTMMLDRRLPGFSARFTGGGTFAVGALGSRLSSPDLRGGGGDGGCE